MTAATVLAHAYAAGLTLTAEGERLRWRGPQPPAALLADIRAHKAELLALLAANDDSFADGDPDPAARERERVAALAWAQREAAAGWPGHIADPAALPPASAEQAEAERQDRAAIAAEPLPPPRTLADHQRHAAHLAGLQAAARARPPSWPDPETVPSPGCWCGCCRGSRWWREAKAPSGWCCWRCHPPVPGVDVVEVSP